MDKCIQAQTHHVFVTIITSKNELTGFRRLPDIGKEGRTDKDLIIASIWLAICRGNLYNGSRIRMIDKIRDRRMNEIVIGLEGELHILGMILIRLCLVIIVHRQKLPQGHRCILLLMLLEMCHQ